MATARTFTIEAARTLGESARLLDVVMDDGEDLGFTGGQYIIVNTGVVLAEGKLAKRAYSVLSADSEQRRVRIAVKPLAGGAGSNVVAAALPGASFAFSGPWGKLLADEGGAAPSGRVLVVATDTGITAALGLVRSLAFARSLPRAELLWLTPSPSYFLPEDVVRGLVPAACARVDVEALPPVAHAERVMVARARIAERTRGLEIARAYLAGDGAALYPIRDVLVASGVNEAAIRIESFFNNPARKAPS